MPPFTMILADPSVRSYVQDKLLERHFHDVLFPELIFRGDFIDRTWAGNIGDSIIATRKGTIKPSLAPVIVRADPTPKGFPVEQWESNIAQWAGASDVDAPTSALACINLFKTTVQSLGLAGSESVNKLARNCLFNAAMAGWTVLTAGSGPTIVAPLGTTTFHVQRLNGFTTARNPTLAGAENVRFGAVSSANPLDITIVTNAGVLLPLKVIGFTPDNVADIFGPGTILCMSVAGFTATFLARAAVYSVDRTFCVRQGGGSKIDSVVAGNILDLSAIRSAVAKMRTGHVPKHADQYYHLHLDSYGESQLYASTEFQRLNTSLPDYVIYRDMVISNMMGCLFLLNEVCPAPETVTGGSTATYEPDYVGGLQNPDADPFGGEVYNDGTTAGTQVRRALITGAECAYEYTLEKGLLVTDAGLNGAVGDFSITNNGVEINSDGIELIFRAPMDRLQQVVGTAWRFTGAHIAGTDAAAPTGGAGRYKRTVCIEYASA
ncbi:MAG: hypothetical protein WC700_09045 [Gemmatimonadaceae bacterium]|jgi:hypothetical protein